MRNWRLSAAGVVTLALGLGAGIAIFTALYAALWQPLPYPRAGELVAVYESIGTYHKVAVAPGEARDLAVKSQTLAGVGVYHFDEAVLTGLGAPRQEAYDAASPGLFPVLGMVMARGRAFTDADMRAGAAPVAIISREFWLKELGGRAVVGDALTLGGVRRTIVGILPAQWGAATDDTDILIPLTAKEAGDYGAKMYQAIARLRPGMSVAAARAEAVAVSAGVARVHPKDVFGFNLVELGASRHANLGAMPWYLLGAAGLILLLACVNVSSLLLSRVSGRRHEFAIRQALGAGRGRIVRQIVGEGLVLGLVGGVLAWWLAWGLLQLIATLHPPDWLAAQVPLTAAGPLAFAVLVSVAAGVVCSLAPAWRAGQAGAATGGLQALRPRRLRGGVIALEAALALVLTIAAALLIRSIGEMESLPLGFEPSHVLTAQVFLPQAHFGNSAAALWGEQALARARALPGVASAALINPLPFTGGMFMSASLGGRAMQLAVAQATPGYLASMGIRLLGGRAFAGSDSAGAPKVVIVNQTLARLWWPGQSAVGKQITLEGKDHAGPWTVVGVAEDIHQEDYASPVEAQAFFPMAQFPAGGGANLVLRSAGKPVALAQPLGHLLSTMAPDAVVTVAPMSELLGEGRRSTAFSMDLLLMAALLALALAAVGVYGTVSYWVSQRRQEMGVRLALGAGRGRLLAMVLGRTLRWAVVGAAVGAAAALAAARGMSAVLFQVAPGDPASIAAGVAVLLGAAALAAYVPARRAAATDPVEALRRE